MDAGTPPLVVVVAAAGSTVLGGVGPAGTGVVVSGWGLGAPETVLEAAGGFVGTLAAVVWAGAELLGGLVVAVAVAPGVGAVVAGAGVGAVVLASGGVVTVVLTAALLSTGGVVWTVSLEAVATGGEAVWLVAFVESGAEVALSSAVQVM